MTETDNDEYLGLRYFKHSMGITHDGSDTRLQTAVFEANDETKKALLPFAADVVEGTEVWKQARQLALCYARYSWMQQNGQEPRAKQYFEEYAEKKASLVMTLTASRTERTRTALATSDPKDARLLLPAQKDTFVLDFF